MRKMYRKGVCIMESKAECYRCGTCCRGYFAIVPKYFDADISPSNVEFIEIMYGYTYLKDYLEEYSEFCVSRCKWLVDNEDGTTSCAVYERRSSSCRNYPDNDVCRIGKMKVKV